MPSRRFTVEFAFIGEKNLWHPYGLQGLCEGKFSRVVNKILDGRYRILARNDQLSDKRNPVGSGKIPLA